MKPVFSFKISTEDWAEVVKKVNKKILENG
jgi:hypothetical protein